MSKTRYLSVDKAKRLGINNCPNFHTSGSIRGMKKYYGKDALLVRSGSYIYNVTDKSEIFNQAN